MRPRLRLIAATLAALGLLGGCGLFGGGDRRPDLPKLQPQVNVKLLWRGSVSGTAPHTAPVLVGEQLWVAGDDGRVQSLALLTGQSQARSEERAPLAAGLGSDGSHAALVTTANELRVIKDGKTLWTARLGSRIVTAPLVAGERVFVLTVDRQVLAFDALDGRALWVQQRAGSGEPLTLLQGGVLRAHRDTLLVGLGPRLVGLDPLNGSVRWDLALAAPRGTNEVERLADLVGPAGREGAVVCARAFQAAVGCVDAERGRLLWSRPGSGSRGVAVDADQVYAADANDRLQAWSRQGGEPRWTQDSLQRRGLGAPAVAGRHLFVGDEEGYLHVLDRATGTLVGRLATDGSAVDGPLIVAGSTVLLVTRRGGVFAVRAE